MWCLSRVGARRLHHLHLAHLLDLLPVGINHRHRISLHRLNHLTWLSWNHTWLHRVHHAGLHWLHLHRLHLHRLHLHWLHLHWLHLHRLHLHLLRCHLHLHRVLSHLLHLHILWLLLHCIIRFHELILFPLSLQNALLYISFGNALFLILLLFFQFGNLVFISLNIAQMVSK